MKRGNLPYWIFLFILGFIIGLLTIIHFKSVQLRNINSLRSEKELEQMIPQLERRVRLLKQKINQEATLINQEQERLKEFKKISEARLEKLQQLKAQAGLSPQEGKGIIITLEENPPGSTEYFLIHASDLRDIVNLLWAKGASAISINNERVVFGTSIDCLVNTILVNNTKLGPPYKIMASGDPTSLKEALNTSPDLKSLRERIKKGRLELRVEETNNLKIPPYSLGLTFHYLH